MDIKIKIEIYHLLKGTTEEGNIHFLNKLGTYYPLNTLLYGVRTKKNDSVSAGCPYSTKRTRVIFSLKIAREKITTGAYHKDN